MSLQQHTRGDDLDDDFVPDDLVAMSEEEDDNVPEGEDALFSADEGDGGEAEATKKEAAAVKKRKRREKEKERKAKKLRMQESTEVVSPASIAMQPPPALSDYLSSMQAKTFSKMSAIELADVQIPESAIADTTVWTGSRNLDQLVEFITKTLPTLRTRLAQRPKSNGAPTLLFIAGAALRVADVTRILRDKALRGEKGGDVAKLFARHFKLEDHVAYLKRTKLAAAAGTPADSASFYVTQDSKKRNLLDIPETRDEVFKAVLGCPKVVQGMKSGKIQLVLL